MNKIKKMKEMADKILFDGFLIAGEEKQHFIDERTTRNKYGIPVVKPIAESEKFFWYICPYCQQIHIESKRNLFVDNSVIASNCQYRHRMLQDIEIDMKKSPLADWDLIEKTEDELLEAEWALMVEFEQCNK